MCVVFVLCVYNYVFMCILCVVCAGMMHVNACVLCVYKCMFAIVRLCR